MVTHKAGSFATARYNAADVYATMVARWRLLADVTLLRAVNPSAEERKTDVKCSPVGNIVV